MINIFRQLSALALFTLLDPAALAQEPPYRHAQEPIGTVQEVYDGRLYPDIQVNTFRNIDRLFPTRVVAAGKASVLPVNLQSMADFRFAIGDDSYDLYDVLSMNRVSSLIIIRTAKYALKAPSWQWAGHAGCRCPW